MAVGVLVNPVKERSVYVFVYNCSSHFSRLKERKRRAYLSCPNFLIKEFELNFKAEEKVRQSYLRIDVLSCSPTRGMTFKDTRLSNLSLL